MLKASWCWWDQNFWWRWPGRKTLLVLIGLKVLVMINSLHNICYFRCSRPPDVDGIKIFDEDDQAAKHCLIVMFCGLVIFIKNFDPINIRRPWAPEITMLCSELIMTKTFKPIKTRRHWPPIWFHIFFSKACLVLGRPFFAPGVFLIRYIQLEPLLDVEYYICSDWNWISWWWLIMSIAWLVYHETFGIHRL